MSRDGDGRDTLEEVLRLGGAARGHARPHINPKFSPKRGSAAPRVHINPNFAPKEPTTIARSYSSQVGNLSYSWILN